MTREQEGEIEIEDIKKKNGAVAQFLYNNRGKAFTKWRIAEELEGIEASDVKTKSAIARPYLFISVKSEYIHGEQHFHAEIDWTVVVMFITMVAVLVLTTLAVFFQYA